MKPFHLLFSFVLLASLVIPQGVLATDYSPIDSGFVTNASITLDGETMPRPGLDSFPVSADLGPYEARFDLSEGSPIVRAVVGYGIEGMEFSFVEAQIEGGSIWVVLPAVDVGIFTLCRPRENLVFFLTAYDADGNFVENDERNYAEGEGGDPYLVELLNPNPNAVPVADAGGEYVFDEQEDVQLDGSLSFDPDGQELDYAWDIYSEWSDYYGDAFAWDDEFDDGEGVTPSTYFDHAGQYHARLMVTDACGESGIAETMIYVEGSHFVVTPQDDGIHALDWKEGTTLTVSVDGVEYDSRLVEYLDEHSGFGVNWQMRDFGLDLVPGQRVDVMADDGTARWHVVRDIGIREVNYEADQISGTAPAGTYVRARAQEPYWVEVVAWADANGEWIAQFDVDIREEVQLNVLQQNDWDASHTLVFPDGQGGGNEPVFVVEPAHGWAQAQNWPIGVEITLSVDDDLDASNGLLYSDTLTSVPADWDNSTGMAWFELGEIREQLGEGSVLTMTDGTIWKQTVIVACGLDPVDSGVDFLNGFGPANAMGDAFVNTAEGGLGMQILTDDGGVFSADFGAAGLQLDEFMDAGVVIRDEDGDGTMRHFANPRFVSGSILPNPVAVNGTVELRASFEGFQFSDKPSIRSMTVNIIGLSEGLVMNLDGGWPVTTGSIGVSVPAAGVYPVVVSALDANDYSSEEFLGYLVVYDPGSGFVTGGGKIFSPAGAYITDPTLEGMATFGFVSKYLKGANVPSGQTEFQFKAGSLNFHSEKYDWMVVAGKKALFKGIGSINGKGNYQFMISAIDGNLKGGDGIDRFRIRIWSVVDGLEVPVYDNQMGAAMDAEADTAIRSGSIVIHK
jgi:hypothetical protein